MNKTVTLSFFTFLSFFYANAQVTNDLGLIHHYPIIESPSFIDVKGNYHGITNGVLTITSDRFGNPLGAVEFDSTTFVEIPYVIYPSTPSSYTITGWVKPYNDKGEILNDRTLNTSFSYKYRIINYYPGPAAVEFNSYISCYYEGNVPCAYSSSYMVPPPMQWYFFAATFDIVSGYHKYYLNGVIVDSVLAPATYSTFNNNTIIGTISGPTDENPFLGAMDDIRFYNRSLSKLEMDTLYYGYQPTTYIANMDEIPEFIYFDRFSNNLTFMNLTPGYYKIMVYDMLGKSIYNSEINLSMSDNKISLPYIPNGIYNCKAINKKTGQFYTEKFGVQPPR